MNARTVRRSRIARLRKTLLRIAEVRLAEANTATNLLDQTSARLTTLQAGLSPVAGLTNGAMLSAGAELSRRLMHAQASLATPITQAQATRTEMLARRISAHQQQEAADKLHAQAARDEATTREQHADANRPFRTREAPLVES